MKSKAPTKIGYRGWNTKRECATGRGGGGWLAGFYSGRMDTDGIGPIQIFTCMQEGCTVPSTFRTCIMHMHDVCNMHIYYFLYCTVQREMYVCEGHENSFSLGWEAFIQYKHCPPAKTFFVMPFRAGILKQFMAARNRVGIGLSYRPARLHGLTYSIPWNCVFLGSWKVKKPVSGLNTVFYLFTTACTQCPILANQQCKTAP
jgi:hypothetical protein